MKWSGWSDFPAEEGMLSADLRPMGEGRPGGMHLSHIIQDIKIGLGESVSPVPGSQPGAHFVEGFLWETALEYLITGLSIDESIELAFKRYMVSLRSNIVTQIKLEKDGIHMTPDGFNAEEGVLESYKCTRKSFGSLSGLDTFEKKFWPWVMQEASYCYARGVDTARWIVLFQAGDYSLGAGSPPRILESTATWPLDELVENWRIVTKHGKIMEKRNETVQRSS
jgi:hypothetical protein